MAPPVKFDAHGLRGRQNYPRYTTEQQELLFRFLGWYRAVAEDAAIKTAEIAEIQQEDQGAAGVAEHWARTVKVIDWLLHRVPYRQKLLEIELAEKEGRWKPPANERGT